MSTVAERAAAETLPAIAGISPLDIAHARANNGAGPKDWRRLSVGRLYVECLTFARRKRTESKGFRKSETDSIAADMVLRIGERCEQETSHLTDARKRNASTPLRFGAPLPRGKDANGNDIIMRWSDVPFLFRADDGRTLISGDGWRLLTAAYNACLDNPRSWREGSELVSDGAGGFTAREVPTDPFTEGMSIATRATLEREAREGATALMVDASAEELSAALGVRANESRAIEAASVMHRTPSGAMILGKGAAAICAREWGIAPGKVSAKVSEGAASLRKRYVTPGALIEALDSAHDALQAIAADALSLAIDETRAGWAPAHRNGAPATALIGAACPCLPCTARRYAGMRAEVREAELARISHLMRNASPTYGAGWAVERAPHDAIAAYRRDALMMGALAHAARTARGEGAARRADIERARAARARREQLPYMAPALSVPYGVGNGRPYPRELAALPAWEREQAASGMPARAPYDGAAFLARMDTRPLYWADGIPTAGAAIAGCGCEECTHLRIIREMH